MKMRDKSTGFAKKRYKLFMKQFVRGIITYKNNYN